MTVVIFYDKWELNTAKMTTIVTWSRETVQWHFYINTGPTAHQQTLSIYTLFSSISSLNDMLFIVIQCWWRYEWICDLPCLNSSHIFIQYFTSTYMKPAIINNVPGKYAHSFYFNFWKVVFSKLAKMQIAHFSAGPTKWKE